MKLSKKLMAGVLTAIIMSSVFAGCANQKADEAAQTRETTTAVEETTAETATPASAKTVELEYWYGLGGKLGETMKGLIENFNSSQTAYKVNGVAQGSYGETYQALQAAIASGSAPACFLTTSSQVNSLAKKNVLENVKPYVDKDSSFNLDDFVQAFLPPARVNDGLYGLPAYGTTQIMYYRKDIFEKKGISSDVLKSWESLEKAAAQLAEKNGGETSLYGWEPMWGSGNLIDAALSAGASILSEDGKPVASSQFMAIPAAAKEEQKQGAFEWMKFYTSGDNTSKWSMNTGYIPVRLSAQNTPEYNEYLNKNPPAKVPLTQAVHASPEFLDPTGGKILDALSKACDKVEIENVPAGKALKEAKEEAQKALDQALAK